MMNDLRKIRPAERVARRTQRRRMSRTHLWTLPVNCDGWHLGQADDRRFTGLGFQQADRRRAECPAARFARVNEQSAVAVRRDTGSVCVSKDHDVAFAEIIAHIIQDVRHDDARSIQHLETHWRLSDTSQNPHAAENPRSVPVVVTETGDQRTRELSQCGHDQRRNEISREHSELAAVSIELRDRSAHIIDVIVGIGEDSDSHYR